MTSLIVIDQEILLVLKQILSALERIESYLSTPTVTSFTLTRTGAHMPLGPIDPGATLQYTATTNPAGSALPAGVVPTWTSSDPANVTITTDPTGLLGTIALGTGIPVGESVTITITATLPDSTTPTGSDSFSVGSAPPPQVTSFTLTRTA